MNFVKFLFLWLISVLILRYLTGFGTWLLMTRSTGESLREALSETRLEFGVFPIIWLLYWSYMIRVFAGHARGAAFVMYVILGFLMGFGVVSSPGYRYRKADMWHALLLLAGTAALFFLVPYPSGLWGFVR